MKKSIISLILLFCAAIPVSASIRIVPDDYVNIQEAIDDSVEGDTIVVGPGRYMEKINFLGKNITITSTDPENRAVVAATIIDANGTGSAVIFNNNESSEAVLSGFTITGGYGTLDMELGTSLFMGGGIYCNNSSPTIRNNIIIDNYGPVDIESENTASYGGAIACFESEAIITRNIITSNSAYAGGGIMVFYGNATICNNFIADNSAYIGGGVVLLGGTLINNTLKANDADIILQSSSGVAGNLYAANSSEFGSSRIINNIICDAQSGYGIYIQGIPGDDFSYNNTWGNLPNNYYTEEGATEMTGLHGNISVDPLFIDEVHIGSDSPCRDTGDPNYAPFLWQRDIDGQFAIMGASVDIGADEVTDNARPVADAGDILHFKTLVSNVTLDGTGSYDPDGTGALTYQWRQVSGPNAVLSNPDTPEPNFTPSAEAIYVFELKVFDGSLYSQPDNVTIIVGNRAPVADAGDNQACRPQEQVTLNGLRSYDPDAGDVITYSWTQFSGPSVELSDPNAASPRFTPSVKGEYVFQLVVSDGDASSLPDTVTVFCSYSSAPDDYGYTWIDSDNPWGPGYHWIDAQQTRMKISDLEGRDDECLGPYSIGFNFDFYGNTYNKFYIQTSGMISFGSDAIPYQSQRIPYTDQYNNFIAWMWTDMSPTEDSKIFIAQFQGYTVVQFADYHLGWGGSVNAEVILYESGKIVIQYKDFSDDAYLGQYTTGIENADGTIGTQVAYNKYNYLHDELAIEFSLGGPYEPVAHAGPDQYIHNIELVMLDGTSSKDRDPNDVLTYQWTQTSGPSVELSDPTAPKPTFMPETEGLYWFELVVSDGTSTSFPDEVLIVIGNRAPVADAGPNSACEPNQVVTLRGSGSYDLDETDVLSYSWTQISGPTVDIMNPDSQNPRITATIRGVYVFELIVSDGIESSQPDTVTIICGMGSVPDEHGYHWIDNSNTWGPKYNWIDIQETGTEVQGITNNYLASYGPFPMGFEFNFYDNVYDYFYIQASGSISFDSNPVTYNNQSIPYSDGYDDLIAWFWTFLYPQSGAKIFYQHFDGYIVIQFVDYTLAYGGTVNAEVILHESGKITFQYKEFSDDAYLYQYTIGIENADGTDGTQVALNDSSVLHDGLVIELTTGPYLPVADAGENQYVSKSELVTLDGSESYTYDPAGIKSYHWRQIEGPAVTLSDPNVVNPTFTPEPESQYRFELVVGDNVYLSEPDEVLIVVHNLAPVALAGSDQVLRVMPDVVTLSGIGSYDPLRDALLYHWNQISGPTTVLNDADTAEPDFVPSEYGVYEFELVVSDGMLESSPDTVTIVLDNGFFPHADAGLTVYSDGQPVSLDGTGSYDPDNQPAELTYLWEQISGPPAQITAGDTATPIISGVYKTDSIQVCEFRLVVSDGQYMSLPDTVKFVVIPTPANSTLQLESGLFDPNKPTIVYFNGGDGVYGSGSWPFTNEWTSKANALCFTNYGPDLSSGSRNYYHCGDMLIVYLSQVAPHYDQAIQTMGWSTGGQPAMDTGIRMNLTYKDARYAVNRITLLDECCRNYSQDVANFTENPVDGEQSWVDEYYASIGSFYPGAMCAQVSNGDHGVPPNWYKDSLSNPQKNIFNGGVIAGAYWSVIGPGKNFQLSRTAIHEEIYQFLWHGTTNDGYLGFYDESNHPGRMLGLVTLVDPYDGGDPNGAVLSCNPCENAAGYEVLIGTDPNRVMDFEVVCDSNDLPDCVVTSLPAEQSWWTVRARDQYGSTIYADPIPISPFNLSLPVQNLTTGIRYSTIRDAIDKALSGDEILVSPGVYRENIICGEKNVTIRSNNHDDPISVAQTVIVGVTNDPAVTFTGPMDSNCLFEGFTIKDSNTGIYCEEFASPTISNCNIINNNADGIHLHEGCDPIISNCNIMRNTECGIKMTLRNGRYKSYDLPEITDCVIAANGTYGISEGKPTILNCTISDNNECGLFESEALVANSIIYFNGDGSQIDQVEGDKSVITYSDVQGSWPGTGNIDSDPIFADPLNNDYHLMSQTGRWDPVNIIWVQDEQSSPCIDAGDPGSDVGLEPDPNGSIINMGAYGGTECASKSL